MSDTSHAPGARAVFVSYAHEDASAARRIAEALRSSGVEVWLDESELRGGEAWDAKIRQQIKECALFLAVISSHTQARGEGYFRREWRFAVERTHDMADGVPFLVPVTIDSTRESEAAVPEQFLRVQWMRIPGALPTPLFIDQVKRLLNAPRRGATQSAEDGGNVGGRRTENRGQRKGMLAGTVVALVVGIGTAVYVANKSKPASAPPPNAESQAPKADAVRAASDKSIAVIPFENRSTDKEANAVFTDGIHEDILTNLSRIRELRVVSRTSVEQYRGTKKLIGQVARELGVTYILEGSVQRDGNKVRVTGQLIRAATDEHIWAENYTRDLTDVFAIQTEIAKAIAGELQAALSPREKTLIEQRPTESAAAYEIWARVRDRVFRNPLLNLAAAKEMDAMLQTAVSLDPKFASAWGDLAGMRAQIYFNGYDRTPAQLAGAKAAIDEAIKLAPDSPDVIFSLGRYHYLTARDYGRAEVELQRFLLQQPNSSGGWNYLSVIQRSAGRWPEAIASARKARQLDPANTGAFRVLISSLRYVRRFDEALSEARRLVALYPDEMDHLELFSQVEFSAKSGAIPETEALLKEHFTNRENTGRMIGLRRRLAVGHGDIAEFKRLDGLRRPIPDENIARGQALYAAEVYQAIGEQATARERIAEFPPEIRRRLEMEPTNGLLWRELSRMEAILGHPDEALRCAQKAAELPEAQDGFDGPTFWFNLAVVRAWTGDKERALADVAEILRKPSYFNVTAMRADPVLAPLRSDPRFEALLNDPKNSAPLY